MALRISGNAPHRGETTPRADLARAIRACLERRLATLGDEIRRYPTPIARCDVQLGALLEARAAIVQLLERSDGEGLVEAFVAAPDDWGDAEAQRLRAAAGERVSSSRS